MTRTSFRTATVTLACAAGLAGAGLTVAFGQQDDDPPSGLPNHARPVAVVSEPQAEQRAYFSVFARPRGTPDVLPDRAAEAVEIGPRADLGANPELSRLVFDGGDYQAFLVPARDVLCLVESTGAATCNSTAGAQEGQLASSTRLASGETRVTGVAPDGVSKATVLLGDGTSVERGVDANVYVSRQSVAVRGVDLRIAGRTRRVAIVTP